MPITTENSAKRFNLKFKIYHRAEGSFEVLPETVVEALEVKVYENGKKKAKSTRLVNLS